MNWMQKIKYENLKIAGISFSTVGTQKISQPKKVIDIGNYLHQWTKNNIPNNTIEDVAADGDSLYGYTGIINWYISPEVSNPQSVFPYVQKAINEALTPLGIIAHISVVNESKLIKGKNNQPLTVIRMEIISNKTENFPSMPSLDLSQDHGELLLSILGYNNENMTGQTSAEDLLSKISIARGKIDTFTRPEEISKQPNATFINAGTSRRQINQYLDKMEQIANQALQMTNHTISWS